MGVEGWGLGQSLATGRVERDEVGGLGHVGSLGRILRALHKQCILASWPPSQVTAASLPEQVITRWMVLGSKRSFFPPQEQSKHILKEYSPSYFSEEAEVLQTHWCFLHFVGEGSEGEIGCGVSLRHTAHCSRCGTIA